MSAFYWERHRDGPTPIAVVGQLLQPRSLRRHLRRSHQPGQAPDPGDEEARALKAELQQVLADPGQLLGDELFGAIDHGDGNDEVFLCRLWHGLC